MNTNKGNLNRATLRSTHNRTNCDRGTTMKRTFLYVPLLGLFLCCAVLTPMASAAQPVSITDDAGNSVTLAAPATRIIPLYTGLAETLVAMGLEDRLIARTASDTDITPTLPSVGTHLRPNPELIAGIQPDLVVLVEGRDEAAATAALLSGMGIPVARFRLGSFADLFSCITRLGVLTGTEDTAKALVDQYTKRVERLRAAAKVLPRSPSVFFEVRYPNLLGAGKGSILTDIISVAGGRNCLEEYPDKLVRLSEETLVSLDPDIYLVQQGAMNKDPQPLAERQHFRALGAVQNGHVFTVSESLFSRPGPSSIGAAEQLFDYIVEWSWADAERY